MAVKNTFKFMFSSIWLNIQKEWRYKTAFFSQMFLMMANNLILIIEYVVIFSMVDDIGGYGLSEAMVLFAVSAGAFGIAHIFFGGLWGMSQTVYDGKLDVFLTQPKNALLGIACSKTDISAIGDFLSGFALFALAGVPWWYYLAYIPLVFVGGFLYAGLYATFTNLCFVIKNAYTAATCVENIFINTSNRPPAIYSVGVRMVLYTAIPALFMAFVPVEFILFQFNIWWALAYLGVAIFWVLLAFLTFKLGLKKYNSGSIMSGRL